MGRLVAPHLSKGLGLKAPRTAKFGHWKSDPLLPDSRIEHDPVSTGVRDFRLVEEAKTVKLDQQIEALWRQFDDKSTARNLHSRPFRILCLDGGGIRGILSANILSRIMKHNPNFLSNTDALFGTSVGGILSLLLAAGYDVEECEEIFRFAMPHIFGHDPYRKLNPFNSKYCDKTKEELMKYFFGDLKMGDLQRLCTVIAFRLDGRRSETHSFFNKEGWRPAILSNMPQGKSDVQPDTDLLVWEAAMMTSAAPTYFPVFKGYTDGGIVANNPSILALSKVMAHFPNINTRNAALLSIGAGNFPRHTEIFSSNDDAGITPSYLGARGHRRLGVRADWGIKQWVPFLLDILLDGDSITTEMVVHYLLTASGSKMYHRLDPLLPKQFVLDDIDSVEELKEFAVGMDIDDTLGYVSQFWCDAETQGAYPLGRSASGEWITLGENGLEGGRTSYNDAWHAAFRHSNRQ
jgi:predicted acylesterase/phospholipase RssA